MVIRPLLIVLVALLVGAAVARVAEARALHRRRSRVSLWLIALIEFGFIIASGVRLGALASPPRAPSSTTSACTPTTSAACSRSPTRCCCSSGGRPRTRAEDRPLLHAGHDRPAPAAHLLARRLHRLLRWSTGAVPAVEVQRANRLARAGRGGLRRGAGARRLCGTASPSASTPATRTRSAPGRIEGIWAAAAARGAGTARSGATAWARSCGPTPMQNGGMLPVGHPHNAYLEAVARHGPARPRAAARLLRARLARLPRAGQQRLPQPRDARPSSRAPRAALLCLRGHRLDRLEPAARGRVRLPLDRDRHDVRHARPQARAAAWRVRAAEAQRRRSAGPSVADASASSRRTPGRCSRATRTSRWSAAPRCSRRSSRACSPRDGYRVSMICLDYGQPDARARSTASPCCKTFRRRTGPAGAALPPPAPHLDVARHERARTPTSTTAAPPRCWAGVMAEFCRRHGRRSIYAGASDKDFDADVGGQLRYARDRWLYRRGLAARRPHRGAERRAARRLPEHIRARRRGHPQLLRAAEDATTARSKDLRPVGRHHARRTSARSCCSSSPRACRSGASCMIGGAGRRRRGVLRRDEAAAPSRAAQRRVQGLPAARPGRAAGSTARACWSTPRTYEGMPNMFLQAWARGVPTVAHRRRRRATAHPVCSGRRIARLRRSRSAASNDPDRMEKRRARAASTSSARTRQRAGAARATAQLLREHDAMNTAAKAISLGTA